MLVHFLGDVPPGEVFKTSRGNTMARAGHGRVALLGGRFELDASHWAEEAAAAGFGADECSFGAVCGLRSMARFGEAVVSGVGVEDTAASWASSALTFSSSSTTYLSCSRACWLSAAGIPARPSPEGGWAAGGGGGALLL